jgi:hypothetical protein
MSQKFYDRLPNGQVSALTVGKHSGLHETNEHNVQVQKGISLANGNQPEIDRISKYLIPIDNSIDRENLQRINVLNPSATVQDTMGGARRWINSTNTREGDKFGEKTGTSPVGFRRILGKIKEGYSALPWNNVVKIEGATPDLQKSYNRITERAFPADRQFTGVAGGEYVAAPKMGQEWIKYLSNKLPILGVPDMIRTGGRIQNVIQGKSSPMQEYADMIGAQTYDPTKEYQ